MKHQRQMTTLVLTPKLTLTTEHAASSYGIPILVHNGKNAYGPADEVPTPYGGSALTGAALVLLAAPPQPTAAEVAFIESYVGHVCPTLRAAMRNGGRMGG